MNENEAFAARLLQTQANLIAAGAYAPLTWNNTNHTLETIYYPYPNDPDNYVATYIHRTADGTLKKHATRTLTRDQAITEMALLFFHCNHPHLDTYETTTGGTPQ